jgi:hypothetical protein
MTDELEDRDLMLSRFRRLIAELSRGATKRTVFQSWELELLLDIEACMLDPKQRPRLLRQYERAVARQLDLGPGPPMKFSEFLQRKKTRRPSTE